MDCTIHLKSLALESHTPPSIPCEKAFSEARSHPTMATLVKGCHNTMSKPKYEAHLIINNWQIAGTFQLAAI